MKISDIHECFTGFRDFATGAPKQKDPVLAALVAAACAALDTVVTYTRADLPEEARIGLQSSLEATIATLAAPLQTDGRVDDFDTEAMAAFSATYNEIYEAIGQIDQQPDARLELLLKSATEAVDLVCLYTHEDCIDARRAAVRGLVEFSQSISREPLVG